jgi:hypothetical protein
MMMDWWIDWPVLIAGVPTLALYVFRMFRLHWKRNRPWIIIFHGALGAACASCLGRAWEGQTGLLEVAALVGAIAWLIVSFPTWGIGDVPPQFESRPMDLDSAHWPHVNGGSK